MTAFILEVILRVLKSIINLTTLFLLDLLENLMTLMKTFFYQPLLKWNPNPFTIFYIGGTNGYSILNTSNKYGIENSQLYFKFQYQFDL